MLPFLIIMASFQTYMDKKFKLREIMNWQTLKFLIIVGFIGDLMSLCNVFAGQYTIMSHALIFSNLGGLIIVVYSLIKGRFIHRLEIIGTTIAIAGCVVTVLDKKAKKVDSAQ
jgi:drug/metabolite transporter (DMT)-like permease